MFFISTEDGWDKEKRRKRKRTNTTTNSTKKNKRENVRTKNLGAAAAVTAADSTSTANQQVDFSTSFASNVPNLPISSMLAAFEILDAEVDFLEWDFASSEKEI